MFTADRSKAIDGPKWARARRSAAYGRFASAELPTSAEEIWRYSRIDELELHKYRPKDVEPQPGGSRRGALLAPMAVAAQSLLDRIGDRSGLVLDHDGTSIAADIAEEAATAGVRFSTSTEHPSGEELLGKVLSRFDSAESHDVFDDLADAFAGEATILSVPAGVRLEAPFVVVHLLGMDHGDTETGPAFFPHTVVDLGANAQAEVVELLVSGEGAILVIPTAELCLGEGANLRYSALQELGQRTWQLGHSASCLERDATLRSFTASLGGDYARSRTDSRLDGQGASAELLAVFLGDRHQTHDFRTLQEHVAPRTTSDLVFKGAVGGSSSSVYSGLIRMRHGARGANAFQTNRNLVLSEKAHADSVPNLDIQENDVRCSHASAVGPIDAEQRFYLQSRGVPRGEAERLMVLGFFGELLGRAAPAVADHLGAAIGGRIAAITEQAS